MKSTILMTWLGMTDLKAAVGDDHVGMGPIAQAVLSREFKHVHILTNQKDADNNIYVKWLTRIKSVPITLHRRTLSSPTNYSEIYTSVISVLTDFESEVKTNGITYHLSPGTPAMSAVWIIVSKTRFPGELIESSKQSGVSTVDLPFDLAADFVPSTTIEFSQELLSLTQGLPPESPEFKSIIYKSDKMKKVVSQARRIAIHDVPILIQGESGTGKEILARAIHSASSRSMNSFVAVNCGAIPSELIESDFFGHVKGAFTGASITKKGYFETAQGGTLFLDEIGELPLYAQVKLLRVLQDQNITKVGATTEQKVDVRIIAATNRDLIRDVNTGRFRTDLFHRLAVGVINLPPLRERKGDVSLLIDHFVEQINTEFSKKSNWKNKYLSAGARNLMLQYSWPGNVREMLNTLSRAMIWSSGDKIESSDVQQSFFSNENSSTSFKNLLNKGLEGSLVLPNLIAEIAKHYLKRALLEAHGNKTEAAKLVGLPNYQTFTNWYNKYVKETGT